MALNFCNNNSLSAITSLPASISGGGLTLLSTQTASSSSTLSFTSGLDSSYNAYCFKFINLHPANDDVKLVFQGSIDGGSNYNVTMTNTYFLAQHQEDAGGATLVYSGSDDQAQGTSFQRLNESTGADNDQSVCAEFFLYAPSSTTFVKHFMSRSTSQFDRVTDVYCAGYFNTTSAINAMQFKFDSGNTDAGVIKLYGIS
tara:strand:- start:38 stop:637 length:600 start_codon:yes stop_codon:yes gene_type:complete